MDKSLGEPGSDPRPKGNEFLSFFLGAVKRRLKWGLFSHQCCACTDRRENKFQEPLRPELYHCSGSTPSYSYKEASTKIPKGFAFLLTSYSAKEQNPSINFYHTPLSS